MYQDKWIRSVEGGYLEVSTYTHTYRTVYLSVATHMYIGTYATMVTYGGTHTKTYT